MKVETSCFCNGHGTKCIDANVTGDYICICENNACGNQCEMCCPKYNQRKWGPGKFDLFTVDRNVSCEGLLEMYFSGGFFIF